MINLPAYAYEVHPGDRLDGRTVVGVHDDGTTVTVSFDTGKPASHPRLGELELQREVGMVATVMEDRRRAQMVELAGRYALTEDDLDDEPLET